MKLSKRLTRLAGLIYPGSRLADVGTDHAYVPIALCEAGRIPRAIAMDVRSGPLERAQAHIAEAGLGAYIETRLSDGLAALKPGEADTVLIAGLGGPLMERLLTEGARTLDGGQQAETADAAEAAADACGRGGASAAVRELVLQPQSEIFRVRRWLQANGWRIDCEDIVLEDGKYYPMFRAVRAQERPEDKETMAGSAAEEARGARHMDADYTEAEYRFGRWSLQCSPAVLAEYLEKRLRLTEEILSALPENAGGKTLRRRTELLEERSFLEMFLAERPQA